MYEEELKILGIHIVYALITMYNEDEFGKSGKGKKSRRKLRKMMNKLEMMNTKLTKRLTSPILPPKWTYLNDEKWALSIEFDQGKTYKKRIEEKNYK